MTAHGLLAGTGPEVFPFTAPLLVLGTALAWTFVRPDTAGDLVGDTGPATTSCAPCQNCWSPSFREMAGQLRDK